MHINFLAASRIQAAIECLPSTCADDHNDRYSAGKGEIEMSTFTPGPWSAKVDETATIRDAQDNQLGIMTHIKTKFGGRRDSDEVAANTRLAADAPAMLDALELCAIVLSGERMSKSSLVEALEKAHALIAKHRGGK